jgi:ribosome biogenesis GTPase A
MDVQWYPGHMTKARRQMQEDMKLIDILIELTDARAPESGRNPDIDALAQGKSRVLLLNKSDLAEEEANWAWKAYYEEKGYLTALVNSQSGQGIRQVRELISEAARKKRERDKKRGIQNRPVRAMIAGIPNVGKSTFINSFAKKAAAKTGNRPGVTKGKQWIRLDKDVELLDTPGILWPKFDDQETGRRLAILGSIRDEIMDLTELSLWFLAYLRKDAPEALMERYALSEEAFALPTVEREGMPLTKDRNVLESVSLLEEIGKARGCLKAGSQIDLEKAARVVIDDFRAGRLGRISLEKAVVGKKD